MPIKNRNRSTLFTGHALIVNFRFIDDIKRDRSDFSSDTDKPSTKKRRLLDSDEETESLKHYNEANSASVTISDDEESLPNVRSERSTLSRVIISDEED